MDNIKTDICVIGAGSGGLSFAAGAAQMGASVVLFEKGKMGGDCLNYGCVPSKSLIESSKYASIAYKAKNLGVQINNIQLDAKDIMNHIKNVIKKIEPHDSVERFESLGVKVIQSKASFIDSKSVQGENCVVSAKYFIISTGSSPRIIPFNGLNLNRVLTNENIFDLNYIPKILLVIGGGPIGCELAQAFASFGTKIIILENSDKILGMLDSSSRDILLDSWKNLPIDVFTSVTDINFSDSNSIRKVSFVTEKIKNEIIFDDILMATGREPNLSILNLDNANIFFDSKGIIVDAYQRTNQKRIFAIGDCASRFQFTHNASYQASALIQTILFKLPKKVSYNYFPYCIYTNPEIAHVGICVADAKKQGLTILSLKYEGNDRAIATANELGLIQVSTDKRGYIYGVTIIGANAGELITQWTILMSNKKKLKHMASTIVPYPTLSELNKRVAGSFYTPKLFSKKVQSIVKVLMKIF